MYSMKAWSTILAPLTATCTLQLKIRMLLLYAVRIRRIREASVFIFKKIVLVIAFYFRKVPISFRAHAMIICFVYFCQYL